MYIYGPKPVTWNIYSPTSYLSNGLETFKDFLRNNSSHPKLIIENAFWRIKRCNIYRLDVPSFALGIQNVFVVEVPNINYTHGVFCISRLRLGHIKHLGYYFYICYPLTGSWFGCQLVTVEIFHPCSYTRRVCNREKNWC